jgi:hypothetical protein
VGKLRPVSQTQVVCPVGAVCWGWGVVNGAGTQVCRCRRRHAVILPSHTSTSAVFIIPSPSGVRCRQAGVSSRNIGPRSSLATAPPLTTTQRHLASCLPPSVRRRSFTLLFVLSLILFLFAPHCYCPCIESVKRMDAPYRLHIRHPSLLL